MTPELQFPALYKAAGALSEASQKQYLGTLRAEYVLLIVCAAMSGRTDMNSSYYYLFTFLFVLSLGFFSWRSVIKPERSWYQGRALAESAKTSSWRFCMRAAPFDDETALSATADFRNHLKAILAANIYAGKRLPADFAAEDQITGAMCDLRDSALENRMTVYEKYRIIEQRKWYARKAGLNKRHSILWVALCVAVYAGAIINSLYKANHSKIEFSATEILIATAASIVGWLNIKRFNELASSYILTAHEIGLIHATFSKITCEQEFREFVNDAEQAFSREHTQWVARAEHSQ